MTGNQGPYDWVEGFFDSDRRVLVVLDMEGAHTADLVRRLGQCAASRDLPYSILAPSRRLADALGAGTRSLYGAVFSVDARLEKDEASSLDILVHGIRANADDADHVYIVAHGHLLSNSRFQTPDRRFGSGHLLSDFALYVNLPASGRKVVIVGDPFQLSRGTFDQSALAEDWTSGFEDAVEWVEIPDPKPGSVLLRNRLRIAERIRAGRFNRLAIEESPLRCAAVPGSGRERWRRIGELIGDDPRATKVVAHSNAEVHRANLWIREHVFSRTGDVAEGDLVVAHNLFDAKSDDDPFSVRITAGTFGEVVAVGGKESVTQPLKGRKRPVTVTFVQLRVHWFGADDSPTAECLCLEEYLYAEKPDIDTDTLVALRVHAEKKCRDARSAGRESSVRADADDIDARSRCLQLDPHYNAARIRFGWASTLHRAQGSRFRAVVANMDTGQGRTNEAYFRWVYTLLTLPRETLHMVHVPHLHVWQNAEWVASSSRRSTVKPVNLVPYDPDEAGNGAEGRELRSLRRFVGRVLEARNCRIESADRRPYQEIYVVVGSWGESCTLRLYYNGRFQVTRVEATKARPPEFAEEMREAVVGGVRFEDAMQRDIHDAMAPRLHKRGLGVISIEHHAFQEIYFVEGDSARAKLSVHYDADGFATSVRPLAHSDPAVLEAIRTALGL